MADLRRFAEGLLQEGLLPTKGEYEQVRYKANLYMLNTSLARADRIQHLGVIDRFKNKFERADKISLDSNPYFFTNMGIELLEFLASPQNPYPNHDYPSVNAD